MDFMPWYFVTIEKNIILFKFDSYYINLCMSLMVKISEQIKSLRKEKNLSQEKLAYKIEIDRKYASLIEKGKTNLSVEYLKKICDGLDIKLSDFFRNIDE